MSGDYNTSARACMCAKRPTFQHILSEIYRMRSDIYIPDQTMFMIRFVVCCAYRKELLKHFRS